ncbi:hypothetical protein M6B38_297085 [Iris pallida]|uniref:Maturase K n=1 Tax=Iris pallida TaxID=29817 RepID=A0AAX6HS04_IRIPA|nr:hypothetical protein M6B38_297085 [Iris pallida]
MHLSSSSKSSSHILSWSFFCYKLNLWLIFPRHYYLLVFCWPLLSLALQRCSLMSSWLRTMLRRRYIRGLYIVFQNALVSQDALTSLAHQETTLIHLFLPPQLAMRLNRGSLITKANTYCRTLFHKYTYKYIDDGYLNTIYPY